jgi:hypothetical protein
MGFLATFLGSSLIAKIGALKVSIFGIKIIGKDHFRPEILIGVSHLSVIYLSPHLRLAPYH